MYLFSVIKYFLNDNNKKKSYVVYYNLLHRTFTFYFNMFPSRLQLLI